MGAAFSAFFAFIVQLFSAAEKSASALNHLATWADEAAGTFEDEARHKRNERIKEMMAEAGITALPKADDKKAGGNKKPAAVAA
jgi:hypothetical protein